MNTRIAVAAILALLVAASLALANPYDKWATGGCKRALQTKSIIGTTPDGKHVGWRKPMTTQRVANYVSIYVGQENGKVVAHNDATIDLLRQQLIAQGTLPKDLPNRMDSDTGETGSIGMKAPADAAALGSPAGGGPGAASPPAATPPPAGGPGAAAPATSPTAYNGSGGTYNDGVFKTPSGPTFFNTATPKAAENSMLGDLNGVVGLWGKAIDNPVPTCVILLFIAFAGLMWQRRK